MAVLVIEEHGVPLREGSAARILAAQSNRRALYDEVIGDAEAGDVRRIVLCSGKIYFDLLDKRNDQTAIVRVEQLYPFPYGQVQDVLLRYPLTAEVVWVQEEPRNMGAWRFVQEQVQPLIAETRRVLRYIGRPESASPATGSHGRHVEEQQAIIEETFAPANLRVMPRTTPAGRPKQR